MIFSKKNFIQVVIISILVTIFGSIQHSRSENTVKYSITKKTLKEEEKGYKIDIKYPEISGCNANAKKVFNSYFRDYVLEEVSKFKKLVSEFEGPKEFTANLDYTFEVKCKSERLVSVMLSGYMFSGGAHGMPQFNSTLFDLKNAKKLELKDLFLKNSKYIEKISQFCINTLRNKEELKESFSFIEEGASPKEENFNLFFITGEGITFIFPPYQVAPYYLGTQEVFVPYASLQDVLDPKGPIETIMSK